MDELIEIRTYYHRHDAELAKNLLWEQGIAAFISADDVGGYRPHLVLSTGGIRLSVNKNDEVRTQEILKAWEEEPDG